MLLGNMSVLYKSAGSFRSGGATGQGLYGLNGNKWGKTRNRFTATVIDPKTSVPSGYGPGLALIMAQKSGGMAASKTINGAGSMNVDGALGRNIASALAGSGAITNAALALVLSAVATLSGSGAVSAAIKGRLDAVASLSGSGDVTAALGAIADLVSSLSGAGSLDAGITAKGFIAADITVTGGTLTTANVADAILDAINSIEQGVTLREATRLILAAVAGKASISGNTITFRNAVADDTDRIVATTTADGERTAVTYDTE